MSPPDPTWAFQGSCLHSYHGTFYSLSTQLGLPAFLVAVVLWFLIRHGSSYKNGSAVQLHIFPKAMCSDS